MPSSPGRFLNSIQTRGIRDTANLVLDRALQQTVARLSRSARNPSLGDLHRAAEAVCGTTEGVLQTIFPAVSPTETASLRVEYEQLQVDLMGRYKALENQFSFPERSALEDNSAFLLHAVCRLSKPANVLETGVANGHSTFFLLQALQ